MRVDAPTPCLGRSELFFSDDPDAIEAAINLCGTCPARADCIQHRDDALAAAGKGGRLYGVWAGRRETPMKRQELPIACTTCNVRADQRCMKSGGKRSGPHAGRTIPRCCPCGAPLHSPKAIYCAACGHERAMRSKKKSRKPNTSTRKATPHGE